MRSTFGAVKKKTVDEIIASLLFLPVFEGLVPIAVSGKEVVIPVQTAISAKPVQSATLTPPVKSPPVSHLSDKDRRSRYMKSENLSTPSISGMLNGDHLGVSEPESTLTNSRASHKEQSFDAAQLLKAWKEFAETVDAAQLKSALSVREPILTDNFVVTYNLDNEVQRQRITLDVKPKLLAHLHTVLHNDQVTVEFNVTENKEEIMNKPYTNQEKFNALAAKYSVLNMMKQRFGLDFE